MRVYKAMTGPIMVNTYLAYDDNKIGFVVDPGGKSSLIQDKVRSEGVDIQYIILTHGHCDHIGGIDFIKELSPDVKVVPFEGESDILEDPALNSSMGMFGRPISVHVDRYVKDRETLMVGDMELTFVHTPGHTHGGMCILVEDYCFSGDTLFRASIGRTDLYSGDFGTILKSIRERLYILPDDTVVLPGHMDETTIGFEKENNPFVR